MFWHLHYFCEIATAGYRRLLAQTQQCNKKVRCVALPPRTAVRKSTLGGFPSVPCSPAVPHDKRLDKLEVVI